MKENQTKGVFTELNETKGRKSAYDVFLESEHIDLDSIERLAELREIRIKAYSDLIRAKEEYSQITNSLEFKKVVKKLALLETSIIQNRCVLMTDVKLTPINQKRGGSETSYIVARASFYNPENIKPEIRVYLGKAEEINRSISELTKDPKFMLDAEKSIVRAMIEIIEKRSIKVSEREANQERIKQLKSIKKSLSINGQTKEKGEEVLIETEGIEKRNRKNLKTPYNPGKGINPKPKSYGFIKK